MFMQKRSQFDKSEKWACFVSWCVVDGPSFLRGTTRGLEQTLRDSRASFCGVSIIISNKYTSMHFLVKVTPSENKLIILLQLQIYSSAIIWEKCLSA
jgi:hypothetical protein